jgi:hypothetical protein
MVWVRERTIPTEIIIIINRERILLPVWAYE